MSSARQHISELTRNRFVLVTLGAVLIAINVRAQAPEQNQTHLTGTFDLDLQWADLAFLFVPQASPNDPPLSDGPSLFTALQEQLGLKLESARAPVDVLVSDHVEKPTADQLNV